MRTLPQEPSINEIQPWHSLGGIEHICELHKSCMVLYGIFTEIVRAVYFEPDGRLIGTPDVLWKPKGTGIWIDSELRWEDQHPEVRPAIYIQLGQIQRESVATGYNGEVLGANRFGVRSYQMKAAGTVTFMHVAATSGESCALADNTAYALGMMQTPIKNDFCFNKFEFSERIPLEKLPKESVDRYASGVVFNYAYDEAWDITEECPILKQINMIDYEVRQEYFPTGEEESGTGQLTINRDNIVTERKVSGCAR